jgi:hypothetical protein
MHRIGTPLNAVQRTRAAFACRPCFLLRSITDDGLEVTHAGACWHVILLFFRQIHD